MTSHANGLRKRICLAAMLLTLLWLSPKVQAQPNDPSTAFGQNARFDPRSDLHGRQLLTGPGLTGSSLNRAVAYLWDLDSGRQLQKFEGHVQEITAVAFLPNGKQILTTAGRLRMVEPAISEPIRLLDVDTGQEIRRFAGHTNAVYHIEVSADGSRFVSVAYGNAARVWNTNTGQLLCEIRVVYPPTPSCVRFDRAATKVVGFVGDKGRPIKVWDAATGAELATMACDSGTFESAEFSPDGNRVLTSSSMGAVRIFDWKSGKELQSFVGHTGLVRQASYLDDGQKILTASSDMSVRAWETSTGKEVMRLGNPGAVDRLLISSDGKRLLSRWSRRELPPRELRARPGPISGVSLWNLESGKLIKEFSDPDNGQMEFPSFLPGTQTIVVQKLGKPIRLIDGTTGEISREYN